MKIMRPCRSGIRAAALGAFALFTAWCGVGSAQLGPTAIITIDENCNGTIEPFRVQPQLSCGVVPTVEYSLPTIMATTGDLLLTENGVISDVIRFAPAFIGENVLFFSDNTDSVDALADVGVPTTFLENVLMLPEVGPEGNNGITYIPTSGQPGFGREIFSGLPLSYIIHSDSVPEPATLALLGIGLAGLGFSRRKRNQ